MYSKMRSAPFRRSLHASRGLLTFNQTAGEIETCNAVASRIQSSGATRKNFVLPSFFQERFSAGSRSGILNNLRSNTRNGECLGYERTLHLFSREQFTNARRFATSMVSPPVERGRAQDPYLATEIALDAVVKIFAVSSSPNYFLPWQNKAQREATGSGKCLKV